mmetsp:Transcript_41834/g.83952  ORF Transcript_41834/g.83952 Transcript_41834/m.83952 type:complete len:253 (+) Transcript_41834:1583-2341(+)
MRLVQRPEVGDGSVERHGAEPLGPHTRVCFCLLVMISDVGRYGRLMSRRGLLEGPSLPQQALKRRLEHLDASFLEQTARFVGRKVPRREEALADRALQLGPRASPSSLEIARHPFGKRAELFVVLLRRVVFEGACGILQLRECKVHKGSELGFNVWPRSQADCLGRVPQRGDERPRRVGDRVANHCQAREQISGRIDKQVDSECGDFVRSHLKDCLEFIKAEFAVRIRVHCSHDAIDIGFCNLLAALLKRSV